MSSRLQRDIMALARISSRSLRGGPAMVQRSQNMEIGYELEIGRRTYSVRLFVEKDRECSLHNERAR